MGLRCRIKCVVQDCDIKMEIKSRTRFRRRLLVCLHGWWWGGLKPADVKTRWRHVMDWWESRWKWWWKDWWLELAICTGTWQFPDARLCKGAWNINITFLWWGAERFVLWLQTCSTQHNMRWFYPKLRTTRSVTSCKCCKSTPNQYGPKPWNCIRRRWHMMASWTFYTWFCRLQSSSSKCNMRCARASAVILHQASCGTMGCSDKPN